MVLQAVKGSQAFRPPIWSHSIACIQIECRSVNAFVRERNPNVIPMQWRLGKIHKEGKKLFPLGVKADVKRPNFIACKKNVPCPHIFKTISFSL